MKRFIYLVPFIAALSIASTAQAETPAPAAPETPDVVTGADAAFRVTVPVMINGLGPFDFVIDTGADRTVISKELAERLELPQKGKAKLHAMGGSADVKLVNIDSVQVSNITKRHVKAAALPFRNLGADGLIGIDSLKGQRIVMDFEGGTMRLEPSTEPEADTPKDASLIVVTAKTRLGQLVLVDADANGQKVWVVVDTGSQNSVGNSKLKKLLVARRPETAIKTVNMLDVLGKSTPADYTIVSKLRIGGIWMGNAAVAFADAHPFKLFELTGKPSMLLGMESLRAFRRVSVDFSSRKVKFLLPGGRGGSSAAAP
jgi:predicted aspartyl protease